MEVSKGIREFKYNGVALKDPGAEFTLEKVREFYATLYPEIVNADIEGPTNVGNKTVYEFRRAVGTKGAKSSHAYLKASSINRRFWPVDTEARRRLVAMAAGTDPLACSAPGSYAFDMNRHQPAMDRVAKAVNASLRAFGARTCAPSESLPPLP